MKEGLVVILVSGIVVGIVVLATMTSASNSEVSDCRKWQEQAAQFSGFYLVQWQADQCAAHNITINAPVR